MADEDKDYDLNLDEQLRTDQQARLEAHAIKLNLMQEAFVAEYLIDLNATQAAIRAGYSSKTAKQAAHELMQVPKIAEALERAKAQRLARVNVQADAVLLEMSLIANSRIDHYYVNDVTGEIHLAEGAPAGAMAAIQSIKRRKTVKESADGAITVHYDVEIRLWDKPNPLKLMGRHVGLFPNRVEVTGKGGAPIELTSLTNEQLVEKAAALAEAAAKLKD